MITETREGIRYEYICDICGISYIEQRDVGDEQIIVNCQKWDCTGKYEEVKQTSFAYERIIAETQLQIETVEIPNE